MTNPQHKTPTGVEDGWVAVGALMGPHGVRGDVRVRPFTDDPMALYSFDDLRRGNSKQPVALTYKGAIKDGQVARIADVKNREAAAALKGETLYVAREALAVSEDEDEFYLVDLIGLEVQNKDGVRVGVVRAVDNFGAEDLIELVLDEPVKGLGRMVFVPFRRRFVPVVDIANGVLVVDMDGWHADQFGGDSVEQGAAADEAQGD